MHSVTGIQFDYEDSPAEINTGMAVLVYLLEQYENVNFDKVFELSDFKRYILNPKIQDNPHFKDLNEVFGKNIEHMYHVFMKIA